VCVCVCARARARACMHKTRVNVFCAGQCYRLCPKEWTLIVFVYVVTVLLTNVEDALFICD
jgi:hypothetical protein